MKKYLIDSNIININRNGYPYYLEYIPEAFTRLLPIKNEVIKDLKNIAINCGQDPGDYVSSWFDNAENLLIARKGNENVGFSITNYFKNIVYFASTMILKSEQNIGLGRIMNFFLLRRYYKWHTSKHKNPFSDFYIAFRTQNPILYYAWSKYVIFFPSLTDVTPEYEKMLAKEFVNKMWPNSNFSVNDFVIKNAYLNTPGLRLNPKDITWSKNNYINKFFEKKLKISQGSNDALFILGKVNRLSQFLILIFKNRLK